MSRAVGVNNGNFRAGAYLGYGQGGELREVDKLSIELDKLIGKQAGWEFARDLTAKDQEGRCAAYRAKIESLNTPHMVEFFTSSDAPCTVTVMARDVEHAKAIVAADEGQQYCPGQIARAWKVKSDPVEARLSEIATTINEASPEVAEEMTNEAVGLEIWQVRHAEDTSEPRKMLPPVAIIPAKTMGALGCFQNSGRSVIGRKR